MLNIIWIILSFAVAIGILVTVHEFGHFWVARKNNVLVKRFSIGFGKPLLRWRDRQGTEFVIAAIPLGGYVRMLDERVDPVLPQFQDLAFNHKTVWQRMAIVVAGPVANILFAILVLWFMYLVGVPEMKPVIASVQPESVAAEAGMGGVKSQEIVSINGHSANDLKTVNLILLEQIGKSEIVIGTVNTETRQQDTFSLSTHDWTFNPEKQSVLDSLGIKLVGPQALTVVNTVVKDSAAELAGLQAGDKFIRINDEAITDWEQLASIISNNPEQTLSIEVERNGLLTELTAVPRRVKAPDGFYQGALGFTPVIKPIPEGIIYTQRYGVFESVVVGAEKTWQLFRMSFSMIGKLLTGDVSVKHLSGPVSIAQGAGTTASMGLIAFLSFLALISVNLAVINLLPLPILDGGHLMYLVVELIRGKPVSEKAQEIGFRFGALVLLMLMGIALFNDISRL